MSPIAAAQPRPLPYLFLFSLFPIAAFCLARPLVDPAPPLPVLYISLGFSILALIATLYLIPVLGPRFVDAGLKGKDLLKVYDDPMCVQ